MRSLSSRLKRCVGDGWVVGTETKGKSYKGEEESEEIRGTYVMMVKMMGGGRDVEMVG